MHLGIDIGGTSIEVVAATWEGEVRHRSLVPTRPGAGPVVEATCEAVAQVCAAAGIREREAASIGVGVPGAVRDGVVAHAVNLHLERLDLAGALEEAWGVRPVVDNDVNVAAVGAWVLEGRGQGSMAYLNLGTGLAAGLIIDGKLWHGARGAAGEIGYLSIDPAGQPDNEGLRGTLETYAGGCGIALQAERDGVSAMDVLTGADDVPAWGEIRERLYFGLASAVRALVLTVDVDEVVVGGGLTGMGQQLVDGATRVMHGWAEQSSFLRSVELDQRLRVLQTDQPVPAIGAAMRGAGRG